MAFFLRPNLQVSITVLLWSSVIIIMSNQLLLGLNMSVVEHVPWWGVHDVTISCLTSDLCM